MGAFVHRLEKCHEEVFGDDKPRSYYFIIAKIFDRFNMHPLRVEFTPAYATLSEEKKQAFKEKFVQEVPLEGLEDIAPAFHFEYGVHRSWRLIEMLPKDKEIKVPLLIFFGKGLRRDQWKNGYIHEGHHRAGAALLLDWKKVPALVLNTVGIEDGYCEMSYEDRKELKREQEKRGLPDTSRICGLTIPFWSEKELRQFMYPRPKDPFQYYIQDLDTAKCKLGHSGWEGVSEGNAQIRSGPTNIKLPWEIKDAKI